MKIHSIGIDLGKTTFHLVALGEHSKVTIRKKLSRKQLPGLHCEPRTGPDRYGGLFGISLPGSRPVAAGARRAANPRTARKTFCKVEQE